MPIPDENTPYQDIVEFRSDPQTKERLYVAPAVDAGCDLQ
jgi:hypothetical protein